MLACLEPHFHLSLRCILHVITPSVYTCLLGVTLYSHVRVMRALLHLPDSTSCKCIDGKGGLRSDHAGRGLCCSDPAHVPVRSSRDCPLTALECFNANRAIFYLKSCARRRLALKVTDVPVVACLHTCAHAVPRSRVVLQAIGMHRRCVL